MTDKLADALQKATHEGHRINFLMHPDDKWILQELISAATAHEAAKATAPDDVMEAVGSLKKLMKTGTANGAILAEINKALLEASLYNRTSATAATSPKQDDIADRLAVDLDAAHDMIRCLIPLAKGYVAANSGIRSTECIIEDAEAMKAAYEKQKGGD